MEHKNITTIIYNVDFKRKTLKGRAVINNDNGQIIYLQGVLPKGLPSNKNKKNKSTKKVVNE